MGRYYGNQLIFGAFEGIKIDCLHYLLWRSEMEWTIAMFIRALPMALMRLQRG